MGLPEKLYASRFVSIPAVKCHIPPSNTDILPRPRLASILNQGLQSKLIFISAPAGYGKSTLLAEWALGLDHNPCWISLDPADNDLVRFWRCMIASIDTVYSGFEERTFPVLNMLYPSDYEQAVNVILNELHQLEQPFVLILDDFHFLTEKNLISAFSYFIDYLPENVHLAVSSRNEPPFQSAKLRTSRLMLHLSAKDLRFNEEEGADFYRHSMKLKLDHGESSELVRRTEGWVTALKLAGLTLRNSGQAPIEIQDFAGSTRLLEHYLLEEVFHLQSEPVRKFLLDCAFLKQMNAALCNAVTGNDDGQTILEDLERAQLFVIPLDEQGRWYRFHHLFSEFLQHRLHRTAPERIPALYLKAGEWCEKQHLQEEALEYYINGRHFRSALRVLDEMRAKMFRMDWSLFKSWLSEIPDDLLLEHPSLYFSYALSLLFGDRKYALAEKMLREAEGRFEILAAGWTEKEKNHFWSNFYFVKAHAAAETLNGMDQVVQYMKRSKQFNPSGPELVFAQKNAGKPSLIREHEAPSKGHIHRSFLIPFFQNLIATVDDLGLSSPPKVSLSEFLYEWDNIDEAESTLKTVFESTDLKNPTASEALVPAWLLFSRIQKVHGLCDEAEHTLLQAKRNCMILGVPSALIYVDAEIAGVALMQGNTEPADEWIRRYSLSVKDELSVDHLYEYLFLVRILIAKKHDKEAWTLSERLRTISYHGKRLFYWAEVMILQSLILQQTGRTEHALEKLRTVLHRTEPEGFIRTYVDEGKPMAELLALFVRSRSSIQAEEAPSLQYVRTLLAAVKSRLDGLTEMDSVVDPLTDILTKQESMVLGLIVQGLTNKEIAEKLKISYGTVKTHINNVYSKLQVHSRLTAIRKGKELGL